jgi:drug/metabolite transporter (DMT)-like permease
LFTYLFKFLKAILGRVVFGEPLPLLWWVGAMFIFGGSLLLEEQPADAKTSTGKDSKKDK